jgi:predicted nucleotidyltransferase
MRGDPLYETLSALRAAGAVRLDDEETEALSAAVAGVTGEVWLFGSRVGSGKRGGDIDILVLTREPAFEISQKVSTRFFSLCEEKVDVVVFDPDRLTAEQAEFLSRADRVRLV